MARERRPTPTAGVQTEWRHKRRSRRGIIGELRAVGFPRAAVDTRRQNPYRRGMTLQLSPEQETRVAEALRSGVYQSPDEVIDRALQVLHEQDQWLAAHRQSINARIQKGIAELERGEGIPEDELDTHLERLKAQLE